MNRYSGSEAQPDKRKRETGEEEDHTEKHVFFLEIHSV
jgi:hypothetical protein